jgi:hypothetical protein
MLKYNSNTSSVVALSSAKKRKLEPFCPIDY